MVAIGFWLVMTALWFTHAIGTHLAVTSVLLWMVGNAAIEFALFDSRKAK